MASALDYRPDIDGLRTVAVGLVVIYHVGFLGLSGGYIGVDVFFVISGFLITRLIVKEIAAGDFSFGQFYMRRLRRLAPSLLAVLALTLVGGYFILSPEHMKELGASTIATVFSASNIHFWMLSGYFDTESIYKPLLHTWSLGVEEQFYLLWPVLLLVTMTRLGGRRAIAPIAILLGLASLVAAEALLSGEPSAVFFLTPFRLYEFAVGAAIAVLPPGRAGLRGPIGQGASIAGIGMILLAGFVLTEESRFPGVAALLPSLGAGLVIAAGPGPVVNRLLAQGPVRYLGQTSYSVYLVHWPLVVFATYLMGQPEGVAPKLVLLALSFALGAIFYHVVEQPFRVRRGDRPRVGGRALLWTTACTALVVSLVAADALRRDGYEWRIPRELRTLSTQIKTGGKARTTAIRQDTCHFKKDRVDSFAADFSSCVPKSFDSAVVILGDSHAADLWAAMDQIYDDLPVIQLTGAGCNLSRPLTEECAVFYDFAEDWLRRQGPAIEAVIYSQRGNAFFETDIEREVEPSFREDGEMLLTRQMRRFLNPDRPMFVIGPRIEFHPRIRVVANTSANTTIFADRMRRGERTVMRVLDERLAQAFEGSGMIYLSTINALCGAENCPYLLDDGRPLIVDYGHYSPAGARFVVDRLVNAYPELHDMLDPGGDADRAELVR